MLEEIKLGMKLATFQNELVVAESEEDGEMDLLTMSGASIAQNIHPYDAVLFAKTQLFLSYLISEVERLQDENEKTGNELLVERLSNRQLKTELECSNTQYNQAISLIKQLEKGKPHD